MNEIENTNEESENPMQIACEFLEWVNKHTHFYRTVHMKLWYDFSKFYGSKGFTTEELFNIFKSSNELRSRENSV